jgi:glycosyltransferase involved in cell wall biosynthesis
VLPAGTSECDGVRVQRDLLDQYLDENGIDEFSVWYYTPMALRFSDHLAPVTTIYDCMDELSAFRGAPVEMVAQETRLFSRADVVFCGGASLYASKRKQHPNVHLFPSSIDREHFAAARRALAYPDDQASIPRPRIGYYGVLDERLDRELLAGVAALHPEWHFVLIGPIVKIPESELPHAANIHYLGQKEYAELPRYLANWEIAMLPFAQNESTRFISPTKTPEYLAGGKPVVSTPIQDVIRPYGESGLVKIANGPEQFSSAIEQLLNGPGEDWLTRVDGMLVDMSWDRTFEGMWNQIRLCTAWDSSRSAPAWVTTEESAANV